MLLTMTLVFTSCEGALDDIFGEWSRPVPVSDITISDANLEMEVNNQAQLSATAYPENAKYVFAPNIRSAVIRGEALKEDITVSSDEGELTGTRASRKDGYITHSRGGSPDQGAC